MDCRAHAEHKCPKRQLPGVPGPWLEVPPLAAGVGRGDHGQGAGRVHAPCVRGMPGIWPDPKARLSVLSRDGVLAGDDDAVSLGEQDRLPDYWPMMASISVLASRLAVPLPMRADLDQLRAAFPGFSFGVCRGWRGLVFEAWRDAGASGLYAVITPDACELRRELEACQQAAAADVAEPG